MDFALATSQDEPQLRKLLRTQPMPGWVRLTYEREPYFFHAAAIQGENQVVVARQNGEVVGTACRSWREVYLNGQPTRLGYLSGLRLQESARNRTGLANGYAFIKQLHGDGKVPGYLSTVIESNDHARRLLTSGRAGLPAYHDLGRFFTFAVPLDRSWPTTNRPEGLTVESATRMNFEEVIQFLNEQGRRRQFFPVLRVKDFDQPCWRGLAPEHFLVGRNSDGRIAGVIGGWDQSTFKQTRVAGYAPGIAHSRWLSNAGLRLAGLPRLPLPGGMLKLLNLTLICIHDDRVDTFAAMLNGVREKWSHSHFDFICCGFHERDSLIGVVKSWRSLRYVSRLYWVCWEDGTDTFRRLDSTRVPHLEVATL